MTDDANYKRDLTATKLANHIASLEAERNDLRDKLLAAHEDIDLLRSLLRTIVDDVSETYGGHEAIAVAQKLLQGGKPDGE